MKFIGQYIQYLISRFRNDVYFEAVPDGTIDSGKSLGLDTNNKLVKAAGGTVSGSITVKDDEGQTFSNVTEISHFGLDSNVKLYDNGTGKVIVDHHNSLAFAENFSQNGMTTNPVSSMSTFRIGNPQDSSGYNFLAGDFARLHGKKATGPSDLTFISNVIGNFLINNSKSKFKVSILGPNANNPTDNTQLLFSYTTGDIDQNETHSSSNNTIQVIVSDFADDALPDKKKAKITVNIDLDSSDIITTSGNYTGSQKYSAIKFEQVDQSGSVITINSVNQEFTADAFFLDNNTTDPTAQPPSISFGNSSVKLLSNIGYYDTGTYTITSANHVNVWRDTTVSVNSNTTMQAQHIIQNNDISLGNLTANYTTSDGASGNSNDDTMTKNSTVNLPNNKIKVSYNPEYKTRIIGGVSGNSADSSAGSEISNGSPVFRNINTTSSNATKLFEDHKGESYRLSDGNVDATIVSSVIQNFNGATTDQAKETYIKSLCVGSTPTQIIKTAFRFLVQGYFGGVWALRHPSHVSGLAALPSASELGVSALYSNSGLTDAYKYYRIFFTYGSATNSWSINIGNLPRGADGASSGDNFQRWAIQNSNLKIKFCLPGDGTTQTGEVNDFGTFMPMSQPYSENNNDGCWFNSGTAYQSATSTQYDLKFNSSTKVLIMEIEMDNNIPNNLIQSMTMSTGNQNN